MENIATFGLPADIELGIRNLHRHPALLEVSIGSFYAALHGSDAIYSALTGSGWFIAREPVYSGIVASFWLLWVLDGLNATRKGKNTYIRQGFYKMAEYELGLIRQIYQKLRSYKQK